MERIDRELLERLVPANYELRKLYDEHIELESALQEFDRFPAYTPVQQKRERMLKKKKLHGMDTMMGILRRHRDTVN